jgi:IS30 family transposase
MKEYERNSLTFEQRQKIEELSNTNVSKSQIAEKVGTSAWVIRYEFKRTNGRRNYTAQKAQEDCVRKIEINNKKGIGIVQEISFEEMKMIEKGIQQGLNNTEISKIINRSPHSIKNEYVKLGARQDYTAERAQKRRLRARISRSEKLKKEITPIEIEKIKEAVSLGWSLSRICSFIGGSKQRIKQWIFDNKKELDLIVRSDKTIYDRISALEMHIEIILDLIKEKK